MTLFITFIFVAGSSACRRTVVVTVTSRGQHFRLKTNFRSIGNKLEAPSKHLNFNGTGMF